MKPIKLSSTQEQYLSTFLIEGLPDNLIDRLGDNQAKIITRHYNRITQNSVFDLIREEIKHPEGRYYTSDVKDLLSALQAKDCKLDHQLNTFYLLHEHCQERETIGTRLKWFNQWLEDNKIYCSPERIKGTLVNLSRNYEKLLYIAFQKDLDSIRIKGVQKDMNIQEINYQLKIVKLKDATFTIPEGQALCNGYALQHPNGLIAFKKDDGIPYIPKDNEKALQSILDAGGFTSFDGMCFVQPITQLKLPEQNNNISHSKNAAKIISLLEELPNTNAYYIRESKLTEIAPGTPGYTQILLCDKETNIPISFNSRELAAKYCEGNDPLSFKIDEERSYHVESVDSPFIKNEMTKIQIANLYSQGNTNIEVAKELITSQNYTSKEAITLLAQHAPDAPPLSNESRKWANDIVKVAEKELKLSEQSKSKGQSL